jgi:hypothetical protein
MYRLRAAPFWACVALTGCQSGETGDARMADVNRIDDDASWWNDADDWDADGDGYSPAQGDCDDLEDRVHPAATDQCDGVDSNCNGLVDDDFNLDIDAYGPRWMSLDSEGRALAIDYIFPSTDVDLYRFEIEESWNKNFDFEIWIYDVPADAEYQVSLYWVSDSDGDYRGLVGTADSIGPGNQVLVNYGGLFGQDDSGVFEVDVRSLGGSGCQFPYMAEFLVGGW